MALMNWSDRLSVGVASIDLEHQQLVKMLNSLADAMQAGKGADALGPILDGLIRYTDGHFKHEEREMDRTHYPGTAAHKKEHADLVKKVLEVQQRYRAGVSATLTFEVLTFLKEWLIKHIQGSDKALGTFLSKADQKRAS